MPQTIPMKGIFQTFWLWYLTFARMTELTYIFICSFYVLKLVPLQVQKF